MNPESFDGIYVHVNVLRKVEPKELGTLKVLSGRALINSKIRFPEIV